MSYVNDIKSFSVAVAVSALLFGCGGGSSGGSSGGDGDINVTSAGTVHISGTLGDLSGSSVAQTTSVFRTTASDPVVAPVGVATVIIDENKDDLFDEKDPTYSVQSDSSGAFVFNGVSVPTEGSVRAQLTVKVDGYAPFQKILTLSDGDDISVLAEAAKLPVLTTVVDLSKLSPTARMNSVIKFGVRNGTDGPEAFSRLMSLSELRAEVDENVSLEPGTEATYTFPVSSFPDGVQTVEANMHAFDSSDPNQLQYFPGEFKGTGLGGAKSATDDTVGLESAAFDMIELKDQNGNHITLEGSSKLSSSVDLSTCNSIWTRHVTDAQDAIIDSWGDYDLNDSGYQVPIWSNDNSDSSWRFVGIANYDQSTHEFKVCIPEDWGAYYLNCDSPFTIGEPKTVCVNTSDQNGQPVTDLTIDAQKSGQYASGYVDGNGHAVLYLDSNTSGWEFRYRGTPTGWSSIGVDLTAFPLVAVNSDECDYDLNITGIQDPFSASIYVFAYERDGSVAKNKYVSLHSSDYNHYYSRWQMTNDKGYALFKVEPSVPYIAGYMAGSSEVKVDGTQVAPETEDTGRYASVDVNDTNLAPYGYIYGPSQVREGVADHVIFTVRGYDSNGDTMTLVSLKVDGNPASYTTTSSYSYAGYYALSGDFNTTAWSTGSHVISAVISDGTLTATINHTVYVQANRIPVISAIYAYDETGAVYWNLEGRTLKAGKTYTFHVSAYDPDGDPTTTTMALDGAAVPSGAIAEGDHNLTVTVQDDRGGSVQKTVHFAVGNAIPIISRAGASKTIVDLAQNETFTLYAYLSDPDGDYPLNLQVVTYDENGTKLGEMNVTIPAGTNYIQSPPITLPAVGVYTFSARATDALGGESLTSSITVEAIASNQVPEFAHGLTDQTLNINTNLTLTCVATDPEGTAITYSWTKDGVAAGTGSNTLTVNYPAVGIHTVVCTATDEDGKSADSAAQIRVVDPNLVGTLTVHTPLSGLHVTRHDPSDNMVMLETKTTDSTGTAVFPNITGGYTSFSLAILPSTPLSASVFFTMEYPNILSNAYWNCDYNNSIATQCSSADWCTLSQATSVANWIFDAARLTDNSGALISSADADTNHDGSISQDELLAGATAVFGDGVAPLTWGEFGEGSNEVSISVYVDIPVGEYTFGIYDLFGYGGGMQRETAAAQYYDEYGFCTQQPFYADFNISNMSVGSFDLSGSGYPSYVQYLENGLNARAYVYRTDDDGLFGFGVIASDGSGTYYGKLLLDQSAATAAAGYSFSGTAAFNTPLKKVTFIRDLPNSSLGIDARYKGLWFNYGYSGYDGNNTYYSILDDSRLSYDLYGSEWWNDATTNAYMGKQHSLYYGDGTLQSTYRASSYPMLNVQLGRDGGAITIGGDEKGKVDMTMLEYYAYYYGETGYGSLGVYFNYFVTPSRINLDDINVTRSFPSEVATAIETVDNMATYRNINVNAVEFKNLDTAGIIAEAQANQGTTFDNEPQRSVYMSFDPDSNGVQPAAALKTEAEKTPVTFTNPFVISVNRGQAGK